jgi:glutathione S-transferase
MRDLLAGNYPWGPKLLRKPDAEENMKPRLYTFMISHFAEKARWALDYKAVDYVEERLVPGSHVPIVKRIAPGTSVPVLADGESVIQGSSAIIDYAERRWPEPALTPHDPTDRDAARDREGWLDRELGESLRRVFYFHALKHRRLVLYLLEQGGPWWGRALCRMGYGMLAGSIRDMYEVTADNAARDEARVHAVFERIDSLLIGRSYLEGTRFSRIDLTLAALAAPLWRPDEHPTRWPPAELYPPEVLALGARFENTRTHAHVMRLYRERRWTPTQGFMSPNMRSTRA